MLFNSINFLFVFLPIVFVLYFFLNKLKQYSLATLCLVSASLYFYSYYKIDYLPIIISSILFNYLVGNLLQNNSIGQKIALRRIIFVVGLVGNVLLLFYFKYFNYLIESINQLFQQDFNTMSILLPFGISFFTIQQLAYLIDSYHGKLKGCSLLHYFLFVSYFPQLIAGPIVRYQEMIPQFEDKSKRTINQYNLYVGFFLITIGLAKKVIIADSCLNFVNSVEFPPEYLSLLSSWFYAFEKLIYGYFDFSGYTDMALGLGMLFNITLPQNFNSPYKSANVCEYWTRWHMTLMNFFRDYLYVPMGDDKKGLFRTYFNVMVVFLCYGIWKSTNLSSIFYGILNGIFVCINKTWQKLNVKLPRFVGVSATFITLLLTTPFLQIPSLRQSFEILKSMFGLTGNYAPIKIEHLNFVFQEKMQLSILMFAFCLYVIFISKNSDELAEKYAQSENVWYTIIGIFVFVYTTLLLTKNQEFLYFIF